MNERQTIWDIEQHSSCIKYHRMMHILFDGIYSFGLWLFMNSYKSFSKFQQTGTNENAWIPHVNLNRLLLKVVVAITRLPKFH